MLNVEHLTGSTGDDFVSLQNNVSGLTVDFGAGSNILNLANGSNTLSITNVQNIGGTDFGGTLSDDTLTLLNDVSGVSINLGQGTNTLNLAAGSNTLNAGFGISNLNGTALADDLTLGSVFNSIVNLGVGDDTLHLSAQSFGVTFVYAENGGADVVSGFNNFNGNKIDLTGVSSVHSLADVQAIASSPNEADTIITFSPGNTLTLTGICGRSCCQRFRVRRHGYAGDHGGLADGVRGWHRAGDICRLRRQ